MVRWVGNACSAALLVGTLLLGSPLTAQDKDPVQFERMGAAYGARQYRTERWGLVGADISNASDESAEVLASFGFDADAKQRYARKIWVPPRSLRRAWVPLRFPKYSTSDIRQDIYSQLIDQSGGVEQVKSRDSEYEVHQSSVRIVDDPFVTAFFLTPRAQEGPNVDDIVFEAIIAARNNAGLGRRVAMIGEKYLPSVPEAYDIVDQIVLHNDRFAEDPVACGAVRNWLNDGGNLWIMLDRVQMESVERLLGERFRCEEIDRIELHTVDVVSVEERHRVQYTGPRDFEDPIQMVRVVVEDAEVSHEVDNWPAAFSFHFGRGRVWVTTVGAEAWIERARGPRNWEVEGEFQVTAELDDLGVVGGRSRPPMPAGGFDDYLSEQIGYRIAKRETVLGVLAAFCIAMVGCGVFLLRRGQLEKLAWVAPTLAILASAPLIWMRGQSQTSAPPTVAMGQVIEIADGSNHAAVTGELAMFHPDPVSVTIGANAGGIFEPDFQGLEQSIRRMIWTDLDSWRWDRVRFPSGVRTASIRQQVRLPAIVEASGTFTAEGFRGELQGIDKLADSIVVSPGVPPSAVAWNGQQFSVQPDDQLAAGQFVAGALLSDEQRRRQDLYENMLSSKSRGVDSFPSRRLLIGWSDPLDLNFEFGEDIRRVGNALVVAPLVIERPAPGKIVIPATFVTLRPGPGVEGELASSPLFDPRSGEWVGTKDSARIWVYCRAPKETLPLRIDRAIVRMKGTIPSRTMMLMGIKNGQAVELDQKKDLIGRHAFEIDDPEVLELDDRGRFRFGIVVGDYVNPDPDGEGVRWDIDYVHVELRATVD